MRLSRHGAKHNPMIALVIEDSKDFVNKLLVGTTFDKFYVGESVIRTFSDFRIGGSLNKDFYTLEEQEQIGERTQVLWSDIKPFAFSVIKGHRLPLSFQFVFELSKENRQWLFSHNRTAVPEETVQGLYMNIRYDQGQILCVSGISYSTFVMDKTAEHLWDDTVKQFFRQNHIAYSQQ